MSKVDQDWREEQVRVDMVIDQIDKQMESLDQHTSGLKEDIVEIRKNFWDDVTVNFDDHSEAADTYASMKQQAELLSERERTHQHATKQLIALRKLKQVPYFGRIDFHENDINQLIEPIYVGVASLLDESEENWLVYDWRAPISSLYYDYPPGPAQYETPDGTVNGTMELKRQFIIRDGQIRSMFNTGVTIGDEMLQEVLGKQATTQMKSIVSTIQKEQNRIIRNEKSKVLIVQGAAGSGKTSAALQRVAYLLYRFRGMLRADQIVLFSPNSMFNSYVSTVLPELGEENMQQTTYQDYVEKRLGKTFRIEDPFTQLEYMHIAMHEPEYAARMEGIRFKASLSFLQAIKQYVERLKREGLLFKDITFRGATLLSSEHMKEKFYSWDSSLPIPNRMRLLTQSMLIQLKKLALLERKRSWVEDEVQLLNQDAYQQAYEELRKRNRLKGNTFDDFAMEQKLLGSMIVNKRFKPIRTAVKRFKYVDIPRIYRQLFQDPEYLSRLLPETDIPKQWAAICAQTIEKLDRSELAYEDATPYLYLKELIEGFQTNTTVLHVFIDEAQDYSPFQLAFIQKLFPHSKMTILGDVNQTIFAHASASSIDLSQLSSFFGAEQTETIDLTRSYRSTRQIIEFTRELVTGGEMIEPFNREGTKPTLTRIESSVDHVGKIKERIRELQAAGHRTIAVICKTAKESKEAYDVLQGDCQIRLINKDTATFEKGTVVIPSYLAKGVEFDAVIIYNASEEQYGRESDRKLFYTACTRAMHGLHLYYKGRVSPFLTGLSPETYDCNG
ncbi:RNA polymerase recycling motor HelD [Brevibacillus daliensis]|uniref:RNA polymerase recycling motor HelD n=1 Tax=Brevibacillus daliensis TaxID=2892995 RepID=UPI001E432CA2|nr:RNA polymerase recycling motor HelD [Brevibacillus daliensis]